MIIQRFNLNLIPNQSPVIVHVNQYDTGTGRLVATLYEGNEPYSPNGTAVIQGTKPDGHGFQYTATLDGNVVTADLTEQMAPVAGDVRAQIVVTESSGVTGTFAFIIRVQPSALPSDADMSESDYPLIEEAIREAQEAVQTAQEATETAQEAVERAQEAITETAENAENSEAWAQGTRGGIPVEPTDPTYEHNAEYWAQYAERYAQGGLHYKASIPFANIPTTGMREGDMYDITDDFTTDSRFTEGAGIKVKGGTNIAWNSDNKWDILALPYIPKTTFNGRSGSILPMAGDYDSKKILLSSILHIGGETQNDVQEALEALENNKAGRVDNAVEDNFAGLDADGNLKDSGKNASDFATPSDIAGQQSLLKDTVGWTGKNLLKTVSLQNATGATAVLNEDGSVTINGTVTTAGSVIGNFFFDLPAGDYILSGCVGGASGAYLLDVYENQWTNRAICYDGDTHFTFTTDTNHVARIYLYQGTYNNLVFRPMIRRADITDPTYEPYHESVEEEIEQIRADNGVLGAKNLLPYTRDSSTYTQSGVTYTRNADGSITANGTATANSFLQIAERLKHPINNLKKEVEYILSGDYGLGSGNGYVYANFYNGSTRIGGVNTGGMGSVRFKIPESINGTVVDDIDFGIGVLNGKTVNNFTFYPMLRLASDPDDTYQPYAMTNRELTEEKINIADLKTVVSASSDFADFKTRIASL